MSLQESVYAWHFSNGTLRFDYSDTPVTAGLTLHMDDELIPGKKGFHAAIQPLDALKTFATRPNDKKIVSRVRLSGKILSYSHPVSVVAQHREHLWVADAAPILEQFANDQVKLVLEALQAEGLTIYAQIHEMIDLRRRWLEDDTTFADLEAIDKVKAQMPKGEFPYLHVLQEYTKVSERDRAAFYLRNWERRYSALPDEISKPLSKILKRDTHFFAAEVLPILAYSLRTIRCYRAWKLAVFANDPTVEEYVKSMWSYGTSIENVMFREPPPKYLNRVPLTSTDPNTDLHNRLMSLAPAGYSEL